MQNIIIAQDKISINFLYFLKMFFRQQIKYTKHPHASTKEIKLIKIEVLNIIYAYK